MATGLRGHGVADGVTTVTYGGIVEHRVPLVARYIAVPAYRAYMKRTLAALKRAAERRAARSRRYPRAAAVQD